MKIYTSICILSVSFLCFLSVSFSDLVLSHPCKDMSNPGWTTVGTIHREVEGDRYISPRWSFRSHLDVIGYHPTGLSPRFNVLVSPNSMLEITEPLMALVTSASHGMVLGLTNSPSDRALLAEPAQDRTWQAAHGLTRLSLPPRSLTSSILEGPYASPALTGQDQRCSPEPGTCKVSLLMAGFEGTYALQSEPKLGFQALL